MGAACPPSDRPKPGLSSSHLPTNYWYHQHFHGRRDDGIAHRNHPRPGLECKLGMGLGGSIAVPSNGTGRTNGNTARPMMTSDPTRIVPIPRRFHDMRFVSHFVRNSDLAGYFKFKNQVLSLICLGLQPEPIHFNYRFLRRKSSVPTTRISEKSPSTRAALYAPTYCLWSNARKM